MSCTPRRSCQQAAKLHEIQAAQEDSNAPPTAGLSDIGALAAESKNSPSSQTEGRQVVGESEGELPAEITHHADDGGGAQDDNVTPQQKRHGLSREEKERVAMLMSYGHSLRQAASRIGRAHTTISRQLKKDPDFAAQLERYRTYAETDALSEVVKASKKSWRAAAWLLTYLQRRDQLENAEMAG